MTLIFTAQLGAAFFSGVVTVGLVALFTYIVRDFSERYLLTVTLAPALLLWALLFVGAFTP